MAVRAQILNAAPTLLPLQHKAAQHSDRSPSGAATTHLAQGAGEQADISLQLQAAQLREALQLQDSLQSLHYLRPAQGP